MEKLPVIGGEPSVEQLGMTPEELEAGIRRLKVARTTR